VCPSCGTENPERARFCMSCGAALAASCPSCGTENPPGAKFCIECGTALGSGGASVGAGHSGTPPPAPTAPGSGAPPTAPASRGGLFGGQLPGAGAPAWGPSGALPEERRKATILFADLSGYTAVAERTDPETLKSFVDRALRRLGQEVVEPLALKGKAEPVPAWEALRVLVPGPAIRGARPAAPLIGREDESSLLLSLFDRVVREGRPYLVTVIGQAGVGKTRLLRELA